ncbi:MAG: hypothetical protein ACUVRP_03130, partial [Chlorobiales bacterium]
MLFNKKNATSLAEKNAENTRKIGSATTSGALLKRKPDKSVSINSREWRSAQLIQSNSSQRKSDWRKLNCFKVNQCLYEKLFQNCETFYK